MIVKNIIIVIFFKLTFVNNVKYKMLRVNSAINSPLKSMSKPEINDKKQILKKLFFFSVLKKK